MGMSKMVCITDAVEERLSFGSDTEWWIPVRMGHN